MTEPTRSEPARPDTVRVVHKHHALVRLSHWANVPLLLGLIASGLSIYWAAPVFQHARDPVTGSRDYREPSLITVAEQARHSSSGGRDHHDDF